MYYTSPTRFEDVRNVGFKNVKPSVCTVRELPQPLQRVVDVQAYGGIVVVTTIKLLCGGAVVDLFRTAFA